MNNGKPVKSISTRWGLAGAAVAAIAASVCCVGPLVLMLLGISGAWIGTMTALMPYQPIFMAVALGLLGLAFYKTYHRPKAEECAPGTYCASVQAGRLNKIILWIFTAVIAGLLMSPYAAPFVFAESSVKETNVKQVTLEVKNMTCFTCAIPVRKSLEKLDGVVTAKVTTRPPQAVVVYDPGKVTVGELTEATTNAGYPSSVKKQE